MLRNIAKFFSFSPGSRHFGNPASRPFSSHLPYPSRPYSPGLQPPVPLHNTVDDWEKITKKKNKQAKGHWKTEQTEITWKQTMTVQHMRK